MARAPVKGSTEPFKIYWHTDRNPAPPSIERASEYRGSEDVAIQCTQLDASFSAADKKRVVREWCELFAAPTKIRRCWFVSRVPQEVFDAVCQQSSLASLYIKWSAVTDLSRIGGLRRLKHLYFGSTAGVTDLSPLGALTSLEDLCLASFQKVTDYSALAKLRRLEHLTVEGDSFAPRKITIAALSPFAELQGLVSLRIIMAKIADGSYAPLLGLKRLEHLDLPHPRDPEGVAKLIAALPKLRSGNVFKVE